MAHFFTLGWAAKGAGVERLANFHSLWHFLGVTQRRNNRRSTRRQQPRRIVATDIFCGAGGLTRGLLDAGIEVAAGYDIDEACQFPYEHNNSPAKFHNQSVTELTGQELAEHFPTGSIRLLVGCAPCQSRCQNNKTDGKALRFRGTCC